MVAGFGRASKQYGGWGALKSWGGALPVRRTPPRFATHPTRQTN